MKRALITGITGQDGAYLAELLLSKGYEVHGIKRRSSSFNTARVDHLFQDRHATRECRFFLHYGDVTDATNIIRVVQEVQPDEIYNLAAQSHVAVSFETPEYTAQADALGTLRLLEAIRILGLTDTTKFYQASTSELFGNGPEVPQSETTPFSPCSPYATAKAYAYWIVKNYRDSYGMFACNGILFNHESPRRGEIFVTRKITRALAHILAGNQKKLYLGNLDAKRDWGFAPEYVEMMWIMLQADKADDYVVGTAESHSIREFVELAFSYSGIELEWVGNGVEEKGIVKSVISQYSNIVKVGEALVEIDPRYFRPTEVDYLLADNSKAKNQLNWQPKVHFHELVQVMMDYDLKLVNINPPGEGINTLKTKGINWTKHKIIDFDEAQNEF